MADFDYKVVEKAAKEAYIRALCDLPSDVHDASGLAFSFGFVGFTGKKKEK